MADVGKNDLGLTTERIRTRVELKLRSVQVVPVEIKGVVPYLLSVKAQVVGGAFKIALEFSRNATWVLPDGKTVEQTAVVWSDGTFGTHGRSADYVLNALDEVLEEFLNTYLRANQAITPR